MPSGSPSNAWPAPSRPGIEAVAVGGTHTVHACTPAPRKQRASPSASAAGSGWGPVSTAALTTERSGAPGETRASTPSTSSTRTAGTVVARARWKATRLRMTRSSAVAWSIGGV